MNDFDARLETGSREEMLHLLRATRAVVSHVYKTLEEEVAVRQQVHDALATLLQQSLTLNGTAADMLTAAEPFVRGTAAAGRCESSAALIRGETERLQSLTDDGFMVIRERDAQLQEIVTLLSALEMARSPET